MSDDEQKYTLREAKRLFARAECAAHGHDWLIREDRSGPVELLCHRCDVGYAVIRPTGCAV